MKTILLAGGTGLVGSHIISLLDLTKYHVKVLTRSPKASRQNISYYQWDIENEYIDDKALDTDYIINLTGAGIADSRWTEKRKSILIRSRVDSTLLIRKAMLESGKRAKAIVSASAIGYYGDRGNEVLDEYSPAGRGFLADCCQQWEEASSQLSDITDRNIIMRVGIVLSTLGGALPKMLVSKGLRVFSYFGDGSQYYSWIHIEDLSRSFIYLLENVESQSVYNGVSPISITNKDFMAQVKNTFGSGLVVSVPTFVIRAALGEMADVVLDSNRVVPKNLLASNFEYRFSDLTDAINDLKNRNI